MAYVKTAIGTIFILLALLVGYMFIAFDSDYELHLAYESFLKGDYEHSQNELAKLKGSIPSDQVDLYSAYVARALKDLDQSQKLLGEAVTSEDHSKSSILLEIRLNQAFNAYLQHDVTALKQAVDAAAEIAPNQPWVVFFQALESFENDDYAKALELWSVRSDRMPLSGWMKKAFEEVFSRRWMVLTLSRCQIEVGKYLMARQTLEEELDGASQSELLDLNFLLGLSYAKEAQEKTPNGAAPYWKLAFSYLNKVPLQNDLYAADRQKLIAAVEKQVNQLLESKSYSDLPFYASTLQAWGADAALNDLASTVIAHLNQAVGDGQWRRVEELAAIVNRMIPDGATRQSLQRRFQALAETALANANLEQLAEYWSVAHLLSNHPDKLSTEFGAKLSSKVATLIPADDPGLSHTIPFVRFWANMVNQPDAHLALAKTLVSAAEDTWIAPGGERKAEQLIEIAQSLTSKDNQPAIDDAIDQMIARVYEEVNKRDDIEKLPAILDVAERFHVSQIDIKSPLQIKRHATMAQDLLRQRRYEEALQRAKWVLKLDPNNQIARFIVGIIMYDQADYLQAKEYLSSLTNPSASAREALAISQILSGDEEEGMSSLNQFRAKKALQDDTLLRLGLGLLERGQAAEGLDWLQQVKQPSQEAIIGQAYALFLEKQYDKVRPLLKRLNTPYSVLDGVQGLAIQTDVMQGHTEAAEKALIQLLRQPEQPAVSGVSAAFQQFEQHKMAEFSRHFLAGLFFRDVKSKNDIAIKYFRLVKHPTPAMLLVRAQTLLDLGIYAEAMEDLNTIANQTADPDTAKQALPFLAIALDHNQLRLEALVLFQRYFELEPKTTDYRLDYAHLLERLRRYDLALTQFGMAGGLDKLPPEDVVAYARCLFHLGHNNEAAKIGDEFLARQPPAPLEWQIGMMRVLGYVDHLETTWPILRALPPSAKLSNSETLQLAEFLLEIGAYTQVIALATEKQVEWRKTVDGLLILAKLSDRLAQFEDALVFLRLAYEKEPANLDIAAAIGRYAYNVKVLENSIAGLESRVQRQPESPSVRLAYAHQVAKLGNLATRDAKRGSSIYTSEYQKAAFLTGKLSKNFDEIPQVHCVFGELLGFLNKPKEAVAALRTAIELDPSYAEAAVQLADQYVLQNDANSAIRALFIAAQYEADNPAIWLQLANLYSAQGNLFEASHFYQNAIKYSPNSIDLYVILGKVFLDVRNPEDAKVLLEHALTIDPKNVAVLSLLLECLHDPLLKASTDDLKTLAAEQTQAYNQLRAIDPKFAEKLISAIDQRDSHDSEDLPILDDTQPANKSHGKHGRKGSEEDILPSDDKQGVSPPDDFDRQARQSIPEDEENFDNSPTKGKASTLPK